MGQFPSASSTGYAAGKCGKEIHISSKRNCGRLFGPVNKTNNPMR